VILPHVPLWSRPVYHLYVIRIQNRDELQAYLAEAGIGTGIHYPNPLHLQKAYQHLGFQKGDFPVSERTAAEGLSLPMYPQMEIDQQRQVVQKIHEFILSKPAGPLRAHRPTSATSKVGATRS
jgi:dTDP-4-amino-4,6-dideoxygalactose transaminase